MSILIVAGTFDREGGRPSGYMRKLAEHVPGALLINGGHYDDLLGIIGQAKAFRSVWWMADVPNDLPKVVKTLKDEIPHAVLVISKNNIGQRYAYIDLVGRMFQARANLSLIIETASPFRASILDPLGNMYLDHEDDVAVVAEKLVDRVNALMGFTRMGSTRVGEAINTPHEEFFFEVIRRYATRFHELVHGVNPSRLLGNASFRCTKGGFPAFRHNELLFISKRNLDKREIGRNGFVAIRAKDAPTIEYYGDHKPSVDAPIQRELFRLLPWARYMIHSHTYIADAPFTASRVPCGALEEIPEVMEHADTSSLLVNLRGHGCLAIASELNQLHDLKFVGRDFPER